MKDHSTKGNQTPASDSAAPVTCNPYAVELPQETRPERRTKLSVIEVVGGTILGLIAGVLTFYVIFVGSAVFLIQIAGKLTITDTLKWSATIVLISVSVVAGVFVYGRTYRRFTRRKHSISPERYDGTNR